MKSRGITGFGIIFILLAIMVVGYTIYQIARVHISYSSISEKVKEVAETGFAQNDDVHKRYIIDMAREVGVVIDPESIYIDRSANDSFRVYVNYSDSTKILWIFDYKRDFAIYKAGEIKVRF